MKRTYGVPTKRELSPARQELVELFQELSFGRVEQLAVVGGEPLLEPPPRRVRLVRFGGENGPRPELHHDDFALKLPLVEFFQTLDRCRNCLIERIEIRYGLPLLMDVVEPAK